ncbi:unnamed protein product, partial [Callosobruchus maculatus]
IGRIGNTDAVARHLLYKNINGILSLGYLGSYLLYLFLYSPIVLLVLDRCRIGVVDRGAIYRNRNRNTEFSHFGPGQQK